MTRTAAVMQPTYMPWLGYFDLIDQADAFVFLDNVQLTRRSWQVRNRIADPSGREVMLSIPVRKTACRDALLIEDAKIDDSSPWREKHARSIETAYAKAPYGEWAADLWRRILALETNKLAELHLHGIGVVCKSIGINKRMMRVSEAAAGSSDRVDRLIKATRHMNAGVYLSPRGSAKYLKECGAEARFAEAGLDLRFATYAHPVYDQGRNDFQSHLGVIDLLAHAGPDRALEIIRSGRREPVSLDALTAETRAA